MQFTKQDAVTFLVGALVAVGFVIGEALIDLESIESLSTWARNLGIGLGAAFGRYLVTYLTQKTFTPAEVRRTPIEPDADVLVEREDLLPKPPARAPRKAPPVTETRPTQPKPRGAQVGKATRGPSRGKR